MYSYQTSRVTTPAVSARSLHLLADAAKPKGEVPKAGDEPFTITLSEGSFHNYRIDMLDHDLTVTKDELVRLYSEMVKMRRMEVAADQSYKHKLIRGFCHLAIGQEAVSVGMESAIKQDDNIITAYRCHTFVAQRGGTVSGLMAELYGK